MTSPEDLHSTPTNWSSVELVRRTVMIIDVVNSVRLVGDPRYQFPQRWTRFVRDVRDRMLPRRAGRLIKHLGDGMLVDFASDVPVPEAVALALECHAQLREDNLRWPQDAAIELRIGIAIGDVLEDEIDVFGTSVNMAARLAALAPPNQTVVSASVRDQIVADLDAEIEDLGLCYLKHFDEPVRAFRIADAQAVKPWVPMGQVASLRPTLAVVPFDSFDLSGVQAMLGDAVADELIGVLSSHAGLTVISRLSSAALKGRADVLTDATHHLRADHVLTGRVHLAGDRLRLVAQLSESRTGAVIWAGDAQGSAAAVFSGEDPLIIDVARRLCEALALRQVERARSEPLATLDSYCLLMAAVALLHGASMQDFERARRMLEMLVERDRRHAAPLVWLAKWHVLRVQQGWSEDLERDRHLAQDHTRRALDLNPQSSLAHAIDGFVHCNLLKDMQAARRCYDLALAENPNEPLAWLFLGTLRAFTGEGVDAMDAADRALALSPLDPMRYFFDSLSATAALAAGQWATAIDRARRSLKLNRHHTSTLRVITIAEVQMGQMEQARRTAQELLALEPTLTIEDYRRRSPSTGYSTGALWSASLAAAGIPER